MLTSGDDVVQSGHYVKKWELSHLPVLMYMLNWDMLQLYTNFDLALPKVEKKQNSLKSDIVTQKEQNFSLLLNLRKKAVK